MRHAGWILGATAAFLLGASSLAAADREPRRADAAPILTVQSELDYLAAAKISISIELTGATVRQIYDAIGKRAGIRLAYEGVIRDTATQDVSFKNETVKAILNALGERFELSYRVDRPDKLTVIGATPE